MSAGSNSTLRAHIHQKYCKALKSVPEQGQSSMARDGSIFAYDAEQCRQALARIVIQRGLPFNHWDNEVTTEEMQTYVQPMYNNVSRMTLKRDAMKMWKTAKQELKNFFLNLDTCVNITTDVWSAPHGSIYSYLCVTAHWIDPESWLIMKRVISFEEFPVPHTGNALFKMLKKVFHKYHLEKKVFSITLDNASNNINCMGRLKMEFEPPLNGEFYHSRCIAHIINLAVQAGLADDNMSQMKDAFKQMLHDVFKRGNKRLNHYVQMCTNAGKHWLSPNIDCDTRWNSTYIMFLSGLKQKVTLQYFHEQLAQKGRAVPFPAEYWDIIEKLTRLLEVFYNATKKLSGVYYPTSHLVLEQLYYMCHSLSDFELSGGIFSSMVVPMKDKLIKYFEKMHPVITCAAALNPCYNVCGVELLIESISNDLGLTANNGNFVGDAQTAFTNSFKGLWEYYFEKYGNPAPSMSEASSSSRSLHRGNPVQGLLQKLRENPNKRVRNDRVQNNEYTRYIGTDFISCIPAEQQVDFDVLAFWKSKETMFPVLSKMARDLFSVQATSVASESAFSTSGRVLSNRRTRLTPASLEMCICLKDHLDAIKRRQHKSSLEDSMEIEEGVYELEVQEGTIELLSDEEIREDAAATAARSSMDDSSEEEIYE